MSQELSSLFADNRVTVETPWGVVRLAGTCVDVMINKKVWRDEETQEWKVSDTLYVNFYSTAFPNRRIARKIAQELAMITGRLGTEHVADWVEFELEIDAEDHEELEAYSAVFMPKKGGC